MKLSRKDLKMLIENFLFEEEESQAKVEDESDLEQKLVKMAESFRDFKIPTSSAYKFSIVKEDRGLCLVTVNPAGTEKRLSLSFKEMALSKEEGLQSSHGEFVEELSTILGGVSEEDRRDAIHDAVSPFVGDFKDKIFSRKYLVQFDSIYGDYEEGKQNLARLA